MADIEVKNNDTIPTQLENRDDTNRDFYRIIPTFAESIACGDGEDIPEIDVGPGVVEFFYRRYNLYITLDKLTPKGDAEIQAWEGEGELLKGLVWQRINLMSASAMLSLIRDLKTQTEHTPWAEIIRYCAWKATLLARQGEPVQEIWPPENTSLAPEYLVRPMLYLNHPTVFFGEKGTHKSALALVISYVAQLPLPDNYLGITPRETSIRVLLLDYEDDPGTFAKRWGAIQRGFGIEADMPILYRRMTGPLIDSVEAVKKIVQEKNIELVIVDSLGPAAGGANLNDSQPAIAYNTALREIGITSLTLAHCSKDQAAKRKTIYGSVFFANLARSVWECKQEQEPGDSEAVVGLRHTNANLSGLHPALGYRFSYTEDTIRVKATDLRDTGLSTDLPLAWQIKNLLRTGAMSVADITEQLDSKADSIARTLRRLKTRGQVIRLEGDLWGLSQ